MHDGAYDIGFHFRSLTQSIRDNWQLVKRQTIVIISICIAQYYATLQNGGDISIWPTEVIVDNSKRSHASIMLDVSKIINKLFQSLVCYSEIASFNYIIRHLFKISHENKNKN